MLELFFIKLLGNLLGDGEFTKVFGAPFFNAQIEVVSKSGPNLTVDLNVVFLINTFSL
jgi:hypothetical protein